MNPVVDVRDGGGMTEPYDFTESFGDDDEEVGCPDCGADFSEECDEDCPSWEEDEE